MILWFSRLTLHSLSWRFLWLPLNANNSVPFVTLFMCLYIQIIHMRTNVKKHGLRKDKKRHNFILQLVTFFINHLPSLIKDTSLIEIGGHWQRDSQRSYNFQLNNQILLDTGSQLGLIDISRHLKILTCSGSCMCQCADEE